MSPDDRADLAAVLATPEGRRVLWRMIGDAGPFASPFATDQHATAFNAGQQAIGLRYMREIIDTAPERWIEMQQEAHARAMREAQEPEKPGLLRRIFGAGQ